MKRPKSKYKIGQVVQQIDFNGRRDFYADITGRHWDANECEWEYTFDLGFDSLLETQLRPLNKRERGQ